MSEDEEREAEQGDEGGDVELEDDGDEVVNDAGFTAISTKVSGHRE